MMGSDNALKLLREQRPEVYDLMGRMAKCLIAKGHDYSGADRDTFYNLRASEDLGILPWKGVLIRLGDKWRRLCNFARQETLKVSDESIEDTLIDAANYCLFAIIMFREAYKADTEADWGLSPEEEEGEGEEEEPTPQEENSDPIPRHVVLKPDTPVVVCEHCGRGCAKGGHLKWDELTGSGGRFQCFWCHCWSWRPEVWAKGERGIRYGEIISVLDEMLPTPAPADPGAVARTWKPKPKPEPKPYRVCEYCGDGTKRYACAFVGDGAGRAHCTWCGHRMADVEPKPYLVCEHCRRGTRREVAAWSMDTNQFYCVFCNRFSCALFSSVSEGVPVEVKET